MHIDCVSCLRHTCRVEPGEICGECMYINGVEGVSLNEMSRSDHHAAATTLLEVAQQQHPVKHAAARALQTCDYVASHTPASRLD
jgi:hypothetical protein